MRNQLRGLLPLAVLLVGQAAAAQIAVPASPRVGAPLTSVGPPAPLDGPSSLPQRPNGPLPSSLTLVTALGEAEARSPAIAAARANVQAAQGRLRQAGFRANPEISVEVENFLGSGDYAGVEGAEVTVALNQRLDLGGRRSARRAGAQAALVSAELALVAAHADVAQSVRQQFAIAVAAREELRIARDAEARAIELARIAGILVDAGREPPLRAIRARAAAAQAAAARQAAEANEIAARRTLAALFGQDTPPASVVGEIEALEPTLTPAEQTLEVLSARADLAVAQAALEQELAARRLDPAVGIGIRHLQATGDQALVAGLSLPIPIRDRNQGNIGAARAGIAAAQARLEGAMVMANARIANARASLASADARLVALENAAIPEAREALRLAELSYRAGKIPLLELLDAQTALAAAETALVQARLARAQAAAELTRATARQD